MSKVRIWQSESLSYKKNQPSTLLLKSLMSHLFLLQSWTLELFVFSFSLNEFPYNPSDFPLIMES